jgi:hypothetical protein
MELSPLLKYASTFYTYKNFSVWSPPEILKAGKKGLSQDELKPDVDVYSFGMLLWELWHEHEPFDNDVNLCLQYVVQEDARPMIVTDAAGGAGRNQEEEEEKNQSGTETERKLYCDEDIAKLIRLCW